MFSFLKKKKSLSKSRILQVNPSASEILFNVDDVNKISPVSLGILMNSLDNVSLFI